MGPSTPSDPYLRLQKVRDFTWLKPELNLRISVKTEICECGWGEGEDTNHHENVYHSSLCGKASEESFNCVNIYFPYHRP